MIRTFLLTLGVFGVLAVSACNTVQGVGKDVESGGEAISDTAKDVQK
ncbi:MAG: entericidin, partial [Alphaproteobacteria bacterium HGW-Alphaproteobacteria-8]